MHLFLQGMEGPRGPPGSRGPQGEGMPGPKVCTLITHIKVTPQHKLLATASKNKFMLSCYLVSRRGTKVCQERLATQEREGLENLELR